MKTVQDILKERPYHRIYSVLPEQNVLSVAQFMKFKNVGAVAVMRDNILLGIVSERDMLSKVLALGYDPRDVSIQEIMSDRVILVSPGHTWEECLVKMRHSHCRHLPVLDQGRLVAMISLRDVLGVDEAEVMDTFLWDRTTREAFVE